METVKLYEPDLKYLTELTIATSDKDTKGQTLLWEGKPHYKTKIGEFAINKFIFNTNIQHVIFGDTFEYKGSIDYNKRNGQGAKRGESGLSGGTYTALTMNDPSLTTVLTKHYEALKKLIQQIKQFMMNG